MFETKIIDNFLPDDVFETFTQPLFNAQMPLFYVDTVIPEGVLQDEEKEAGSQFFQFVHNFYVQELMPIDNSLYGVAGSKTETFPAVEEIVVRVGRLITEMTTPSEVCLFRAKLNVIPRADAKRREGFHCDRVFTDKRTGMERVSPHVVGLLYLTTTNGPTVFEDGEEIDCVANRLVLFDGTRKHTSTSCTDAKIRAALNLNYFLIR